MNTDAADITSEVWSTIARKAIYPINAGAFILTRFGATKVLVGDHVA
jgi:hypothetical protein